MLKTGNEKITQSYEYAPCPIFFNGGREIKEKLLTLEYVRNELNDYKASMKWERLTLNIVNYRSKGFCKEKT